MLAEDFQGASGSNIFGVRRADGDWRLRATAQWAHAMINWPHMPRGTIWR